MTSFELCDVGLVCLDMPPESEYAQRLAQRLGQHNLTVRHYPYNIGDSLVGSLFAIQSEVRFIVFLFSSHTPVLTSLAATTVLQSNDDWVVFVRCEDYPRHDILADRDHFDFFGDEAEVQLTKMIQSMQRLLKSVRDQP